jgi:ATP/maltotriose-dependent transcriptional regulator MalT
VVEDRWVLAAVLNRACVSSLAPHNLAERRLMSAESLEIARELGDRTLEFWANCGVFFAAFNAADRAVADTALAEAMALADGIGRPSFRWFARALRTSLLTAVAHPDDAEASAHETFQIGTEAGEPDAFDYFAAALMMTRFMQGRGMEVMDLLRQAVDDHPQLTAYSASLAAGLAEEGYLDESSEILAAAQRNGFEVRINTAWSVTAGPWALAAALVADPVYAAPLYEALAPFSGQIAATRTHAHYAVDIYLGPLAMVLGNHEQAEAHLSEADRVAKAFGAHGYASRNDVLRARYVQSQGDIGGARRLAEQARDGAHEAGYGLTERFARELLETLPET